MAKFRKNPIVIEAVQFDGTETSIIAIMNLVPRTMAIQKQIDVDHGGKTIFIHTLEGKMEASINDWIIRGVNNELYPCKPDIFQKTYEQVYEEIRTPTFERELESLINRYSKENGSNTPDFILASYLNMCLNAFDITSRDREKWYGKELKI